MSNTKLILGDCLDVLPTLPADSVHCVVTSPPYWGLRDYGVDGAIGLEETPEEFIAKMVDVFREVRRVLREDGTLWLNLGDSYATSSSSLRTRVRMSVDDLTTRVGEWLRGSGPMADIVISSRGVARLSG